MKRYITLLLICFMITAAKAQTIVQTINSSMADIKTLQCTFRQENHLKMLSDVVTSEGKMYYSGGNKLRWEYVSPYTYTLILNDNQALVKKNGREDHIDMDQSKMFREIARIMMNAVMGKSLGDEKSFKTEIVEKGGFYEATMIPVKKDLQQMFPSITLGYDKGQKIITRVTLHQKNGDRTEITLGNIVRNGKISDNVFSIE